MLPISGIVPLTTIDFPGNLSAVIFTQGCDWDCEYCHNPTFKSVRTPEKFSEGQILDWIEQRKNFVDSIVISGGEPTIHKELETFVIKVRETGLSIGLHTNGSCPARLSRILPHLSWIGFDYKAPSWMYSKVTKSLISYDLVELSLKHLVSMACPYEVRTTWHPSIMPDTALISIAKELSAFDVKSWTIQLANIPTKHLVSLSDAVISKIKNIIDLEVR